MERLALYFFPFLLLAGCTGKNPDENGVRSITGRPVYENGQAVGGVLNEKIGLRNARVLCGFSQSYSTSLRYFLSCRAAVVNDDGTITEAKGIEDGVALSWEAPFVISGIAIASQTCQVADNKLSQNCDVELVRLGSEGSKIQTDLTLKSTDGQAVASGIVLLPYSVQSIGLPAQIPQVFSTVDLANEEISSAKLQLTNPGLDPLTTNFGRILTVCEMGKRTFFATRQHVYVMEKSKVQLYSGSTNIENTSEFSHRLRVYFQSAGGAVIRIGCSKDSVFVLDSVPGRVIRLSESGPVKSFPINAEAMGFAAHADGTLYLADTFKNVIQRIDPDGKITKIAGTGTKGASGDGGPAIDATVNEPMAIAVSQDRNVYFIEGSGDNIRKIAPDGIISTFFKSPNRFRSEFPLGPRFRDQPAGIQTATDGTLWVTDNVNHQILHIKQDGASEILSTKAVLDTPSGLYLRENGTLLVSAQVLKQISLDGKVEDIAGTTITEVPMTTTKEKAKLSAVTGMAFDGSGNLLFSDMGGIRKLDSTGSMTMVPNPDPIDQKYHPYFLASGISGMAMAPNGDLYFVTEQKIKRLNPQGQITTIAGTGAIGYSGDGGPALAATFCFPKGLARANDGTLFVADFYNHVVRKITPEGIISTIAGTGVSGSPSNGGLATGSAFASPYGIALDPYDNTLLYIADNWNSTVHRLDLKSGILTHIAGIFRTGPHSYDGIQGGSALQTHLTMPTDLKVSASGELYLVLPDASRVVILKKGDNGTYTISTIFGGTTQKDCGSGIINGKADSKSITQKIDASLGVLCVGSPLSVAISDKCSDPNDSVRIAISQSMEPEAYNAEGVIALIEKPCSAH